MPEVLQRLLAPGAAPREHNRSATRENGLQEVSHVWAGKAMRQGQALQPLQQEQALAFALAAGNSNELGGSQGLLKRQHNDLHHLPTAKKAGLAIEAHLPHPSLPAKGCKRREAAGEPAS